MRPGAGDYGQPSVLIPAPRDERYAHLGWPKIVRTADGRLVVAFIAGREHTVGGCPAVAVSKDDGETFSEPRMLRQFGPGEDYAHSGNVALGMAADGALVLLAMAFSGDERNTVVGWRSEDAGESWQDVDTSSLADNATGSVYGHVFAVPGKGLAVCGHYRRPLGDGLWIAFSRDDGRSWGPPQTISDRHLFEPAFVCSDGQLIGLVRENEAHGYWQFVSADTGDTWREPRLVMHGAEATHPSPFLAVDPESPRRLLALQSQRTRRGEIYLWRADADVLDWQRMGVVATFEGFEDYAYPWMSHMSGDDWFLVLYAGRTRGQNSIFGMKVSVD